MDVFYTGPLLDKETTTDFILFVFTAAYYIGWAQALPLYSQLVCLFIHQILSRVISSSFSYTSLMCLIRDVKWNW